MHRLFFISVFISMLTFPAAARQFDWDAPLKPVFDCEANTDNRSWRECSDAAVRQAREERETDPGSGEIAQANPVTPAPMSKRIGSPPRTTPAEIQPAPPAARGAPVN